MGKKLPFRRDPARGGSKSRGFCCYCKRGLTCSLSNDSTAFTFDHINPHNNGGGRKVPCCRTCNQLKGDIHPVEWMWFIDMHQGWWKTFRTNREVLIAIAMERARRVAAGEPPIVPGATPWA